MSSEQYFACPQGPGHISGDQIDASSEDFLPQLRSRWQQVIDFFKNLYLLVSSQSATGAVICRKNGGRENYCNCMRKRSELKVLKILLFLFLGGFLYVPARFH